MTKRPFDDQAPARPRRRTVLKQGAAIGAAGMLAPAGIAFAQSDDLAAYRSAKVNWRQAEGESITSVRSAVGKEPGYTLRVQRFESLGFGFDDFLIRVRAAGGSRS